MDYRLSKNFLLSEFLESDTARRHGFNEQFTPSDEVIDHLQLLVDNVLQPIRDMLPGRIVVTSGYRCQRLNDHVKGSPKSQHVTGEAADLKYYQPDGEINNARLYKVIVASGVKFDQLINEYGFAWVHVSYTHFRTNQMEQLTVK